MAKPDWSELQKQFLSDHAKSGISPKEWCEDQGLNYVTARRYIKKPAAQSAQKTAHKKLRTAHEKECAKEAIHDSDISTAQGSECVSESAMGRLKNTYRELLNPLLS